MSQSCHQTSYDMLNENVDVRRQKRRTRHRKVIFIGQSPVVCISLLPLKKQLLVSLVRACWCLAGLAALRAAQQAIIFLRWPIRSQRYATWPMRQWRRAAPSRVGPRRPSSAGVGWRRPASAGIGRRRFALPKKTRECVKELLRVTAIASTVNSKGRTLSTFWGLRFVVKTCGATHKQARNIFGWKNLKEQSNYSHAVPFKMYWVGLNAFNPPPI